MSPSSSPNQGNSTVLDPLANPVACVAQEPLSRRSKRDGPVGRANILLGRSIAGLGKLQKEGNGDEQVRTCVKDCRKPRALLLQGTQITIGSGKDPDGITVATLSQALRSSVQIVGLDRNPEQGAQLWNLLFQPAESLQLRRNIGRLTINDANRSYSSDAIAELSHFSIVRRGPKVEETRAQDGPISQRQARQSRDARVIGQ